jgi:hypothetical protein
MTRALPFKAGLGSIKQLGRRVSGPNIRRISMKNQFLRTVLTLVVMAFIVSCATTIPVSVDHPPDWKTDGVERLTVAPFKGSGSWQQIADRLTVEFRNKIGELGTFSMVDYSTYQKGTVDAVFTGEVTNFTVNDTSRKVERKNKEGQTVQVTIYDRKVSLGFTYRLIRDRDGEVLGSDTLNISATDSNENASELNSAAGMAFNALPGNLRDFNKKLVPWTSSEKLVLDKETSKDKALKTRMKEAAALVKAGSYKAAQEEYAKIYAETNSLAAGYNQAILAQPLEGLEAAISLMSTLQSATGYRKAAVEVERLRGFLSEGQKATSSTAGESIQTIATKKALAGLAAVLPSGSRVSLINISKSDKELTDVIIRDISPELMKNNITVLERENLALIEAEKNFQVSGEVSDESYVSVGKMLGVETIVTFSIFGSGHQRKLTIKAVSIETGKVTYNDSTEI